VSQKTELILKNIIAQENLPRGQNSDILLKMNNILLCPTLYSRKFLFFLFYPNFTKKIVESLKCHCSLVSEIGDEII